MLRIRVPGGELNSRQLKTIGELSKSYARGFPTLPPGRIYGIMIVKDRR
jgi:hypothetical protein